MTRTKGVFTFHMASYLVTILAILSMYGAIMVRAQSGNETRLLRIAVPPKSGFTQFVKITWDPVTNQRNFSGFAIEVFNQAVASTFDKSTSFQFIPFQTSEGSMNGSYDDMVEAVHNKEYDGAVGDITIRFSRTKWVDFTVAYTDIGISMLIPVHQKNTNLAKSLNSLTKDMVIGTFVLFFLSILVFVGSDIVNLIILRRNKDNAIQPRSIRPVDDGADESKQSKCATAELNEENEAWKRSFVFDLLKGFGIPETQLFAYHSESELLDMLSKGANDGGITVVIDETPPLSVFLAQNCKNYTLVPINSLHSSGYGFAFPKRSNLVQDVSNGIIKLIDNGQLGRIQARTIGGLGTCDVDPAVDNVSDITTPNIVRTFKACAIASVVLLALTYVVSIITSNRRCLRYLFP